MVSRITPTKKGGVQADSESVRGERDHRTGKKKNNLFRHEGGKSLGKKGRTLASEAQSYSGDLSNIGQEVLKVGIPQREAEGDQSLFEKRPKSVKL